MTWDPPSDSDLAADKPAKASDARRVRDLFEAVAARDTGAPWLNGRGAYEVLSAFSFSGAPNPNATYLRGNWTVPDGVTTIEVIAIGGGGCGGEAQNTVGSDGASGGGGGGAGAVQIRVLEVSPGEVFPVTLGAGGHPTEVSPFIDTTLDDWELGDGGRTTFGVFPRVAVAGGGRRGYDGDGTSTEGLGGEGGTTVILDGSIPSNPTIEGAAGGRAFRSVPSGGSGPLYSGRGARSIMGAGGAGRVTGVGGNNAPCSGAGGGGAYPDAFPSGTVGGLGGNGIVILRY